MMIAPTAWVTLLAISSPKLSCLLSLRLVFIGLPPLQYDGLRLEFDDRV